MAKEKSVFMCTDCGNEYGKWAGQCDACKQWNTLKEIKVTSVPKNTSARTTQKIEHSVLHKKKIQRPAKPAAGENNRYKTGIPEFDR